jgi:uncharacterized protein YkwD
MKLLFVVLGFLVLQLKDGDPIIDRKEATAAFDYLNQIRTDPAAFKKQFKFLSGMKAMPKLQWNDTLAKVAEAKAMDMAKRNYFAHVDPDGYGINYFMDKAGYKLNKDWLKTKGENYFESLSAGGGSGIGTIDNLIIDATTPSLGHRKHLLGMDSWNASLVDIGIGYVNTNGSSIYPSYACVIIAKHNW